MVREHLTNSKAGAILNEVKNNTKNNILKGFIKYELNSLPLADELGIDEKISYSDLKNKLNNISTKYELPLDLEAPIITLSAGEKQRVEIVRILLQDPQLLIMDEPTSVLTPQEVKNLFKTLEALIREGRKIGRAHV
jgi:simple sugar transport system ATP-binding protein